MVNKAWLLRIKKRGKELKVPHHASAVAARDGNMPHVKATCLIQLPLAFIPNTSKDAKWGS